MDFDNVLDQASEAARAQRAESRRSAPTYVTAIVKDAMAENPDIEMADLIRTVLVKTENDVAGIDAMTDDEMMRLITIGQRTMAVARTIRKKAEQAEGGAQ